MLMGAELMTVRGPGQRARIVLIVDGEEIVRDMLTDLLAEIGVRTLCASSGAEGRDIYWAQRGCIAGAIVDLSMPGMAADEEACWLSDICSSLPIVLLGGYATGDRAGTHGECPKPSLSRPFQVDILLQSIAAAFAGLPAHN